MKKIFKRLSAVVLAMTMMFTLIACGGSGEGTGSSERELNEDAVVTFGLASAWDVLNPYTSSGGSFAGLVFEKIFDRLVYVDSNFEVHPRAAESWKIDGNKLTVYLNKNSKWHDGTAVTANDWVFTIQYASSSEAKLISHGFCGILEGTTLGGVETSKDSAAVKALDDYTLELTLKKEYVESSVALTYMKNMWVLPKHILGNLSDQEISDSDFWSNPIGSGPCIYESQIAGSEITLKSNENYQLGKPKFSKLVFKVVAQSNFANAIASGEVDITYTHMESEVAMSLEGTSGIKVQKQTNPTFLQLWGFDNTRVPTSIRNACNLAIDKKVLVDNYYAGAGALTESIILPGSDYYVDKTDKGQNLDKAKKLVDEAIAAGEWSADQVLEIGVNSDSRKSQAEVMVQWLASAGIKAKVTMYDSATMWANMFGKKLDSCMMGIMPTNDPLSMAGLYKSNTTTYFWVQNPGFTELIEKIEVESDSTKRHELVKQFQELEWSECPVSWICAQYSYAVTSDRLEADPFASDMINNDVWNWKVYK
ncbi:MAG: ABC transporter substrate-binding protein [Lachnospira sp.]